MAFTSHPIDSARRKQSDRGAANPTKRAAKKSPGAAAKPATKKPARKTAAAKSAIEEERPAVPCLSCGLCCTYIAVEINGPTTVKRASEILWHLYHERVSIFRDCDDEWYVQFEARCQHLQDDNKCGIYAVRPHVCREYSEITCEVNADDGGETFFNATQFLEFLSENRRRVHKQLMDGYAPTSPTVIAGLARKKNGEFRKRLTVLRQR